MEWGPVRAGAAMPREMNSGGWGMVDELRWLLPRHAEMTLTDRGIAPRPRRWWCLALAIAAAALAPTLVPSVANAALPPTYTATIGGSGHATIYPSGLDVDAAGNVYVADTGNDQVKAYDASGSLLWAVGTRAPTALGVFVNPRDVAYRDGRVYVADTGNNRVQILDAATGAAVTQWTGFTSIMGISAGVDGSGNAVILVTLDTQNVVRVYTPDGSLVRAIGTGTAGSANGQLNNPRDAATDSAGNVYVADYLNNRMQKFSHT